MKGVVRAQFLTTVIQVQHKEEGSSIQSRTMCEALRCTAEEFAHKKATQLPSGATVGAGLGVVCGGAIGWLSGLGAISLAWAPLGDAGAFLGGLSGIGVGGACGALWGALTVAIVRGFYRADTPAPSLQGRVLSVSAHSNHDSRRHVANF